MVSGQFVEFLFLFVFIFSLFYSVIASLVLPCLSAMEGTNSQGMDRGYGNHTEEIKIIHN